MKKYQTYLGIMTCPMPSRNPPFGERGFYRQLSRIGEQMNLKVFVFFPSDVHFAKNRVLGYRYREPGGWGKESFPLPNLIYDRCFYPDPQTFRRFKPVIQRLKERNNIEFLGYGLQGKWHVYRMLAESRKWQKWLPETKRLASLPDLFTELNNHENTLILKPAGGSLGKGVLKVSLDERFSVEGKNFDNRNIRQAFDKRPSFQKWLKQFMKGRSYIIQHYLSLTTPDGKPFDCRMLVQKNERGNWEKTGIAVRAGTAKGVTSNLHGGGRAYPFTLFLQEHYSQKVIADIQATVEKLAAELPPYIESRHGRLVELGIDLGIDQNGNVWIIEVNSKPGRKVFRQIGDRESSIRAVTSPMKYAVYLSKRMEGGI